LRSCKRLALLGLPWVYIRVEYRNAFLRRDDQKIIKMRPFRESKKLAYLVLSYEFCMNSKRERP